MMAGTDALSLSLLKFKQRVQPDLGAWIDCAAQLLGQLPFSSDTIIIRALRHDETNVRPDFPSALDLLGHSLALHLRCRYLPTLLIKSRPTLPNKYLTRRSRRSQLQDVYHVTPDHSFLTSSAPDHSFLTSPTPDQPLLTSSAPDQPLPAPSPPFLIIDDILTTGNTMRTLINTIRRDYNPASPIRTFTLTRAGYSRQTHPMTAGDKNILPHSLLHPFFANTV